VCDIADADRVDDEYHELVRPNRRDQYKEADQGTFFANLKNAGDSLNPTKKMHVFANESNWVEWATEQVGLPKASVGRFYTLIKDEKVSQIVNRWVNYEFGRETFVISHWTSLQSQRMIKVRRPLPFYQPWLMIIHGRSYKYSTGPTASPNFLAISSA
jgi:hypothetical protein